MNDQEYDYVRFADEITKAGYQRIPVTDVGQVQTGDILLVQPFTSNERVHVVLVTRVHPRQANEGDELCEVVGLLTKSRYSGLFVMPYHEFTHYTIIRKVQE